MKKNKLLYFLIASVCTLTSCNSNSHTEQPIDTTRPIISADGKTITYGLYPQSYVSDSSLVSLLDSYSTADLNGWYLYEGEYYAKAFATPFQYYSTDATFSNGSKIIKDVPYWFKCEPIVWNILSNTYGKYYIASSVLLDAHGYYKSDSTRTIDGQTIYPNNYSYSDIRAWLNEDFYNSAFALGNEYIQTTTVDNSASTTDSTSNKYACDNTEDKVFLPSYQDYLNSEYDFSTSTEETDTRCCRTTDWARARGARYDRASLSYFYNCIYWTRSPDSDSSYHEVSIVNDEGALYASFTVNNTYVSVRPAITLKIA